MGGKSELTFGFLDDLMLAASRGRVAIKDVISSLLIDELGPLVELLLYSRSANPIVPAVDLFPRQRRVLAIRDALSLEHSGKPVYLEDADTGMTAGFISTAHKSRSGMPWDDFCLKARQAATRVGLGDVEARALIGALGEIEENVHCHSQRAHDALVAFSARPGRFEFAVGDNGIGVLSSLRSHRDYMEMTDAGSSLRVALDNGNSRFGRASGHGTGFNGLFIGLAALNGSLRFRTDDHALTITGIGPRLVSATTLQRLPLQGFLASVVCKPLQASLLH